MRQHAPSVPASTGARSPGLQHSTRAPLSRLLVASALGITSPFFFSPLGAGPWWWQPVIALAVLLVAALLGEWLARAGRGAFAPAQLLRGPLAAVVAFGGLGLAFLALRRMAEAVGSPPGTGQAAGQSNFLAALLVPVLVGLTGALVAQRSPSASLALGGAALGWLVATVANVVSAVLGPNVEGVLTSIIIAVALSMGGFALALLGGVLGRALAALAAWGAA